MKSLIHFINEALIGKNTKVNTDSHLIQKKKVFEFMCRLFFEGKGYYNDYYKKDINKVFDDYLDIYNIKNSPSSFSYILSIFESTKAGACLGGEVRKCVHITKYIPDKIAELDNKKLDDYYLWYNIKHESDFLNHIVVFEIWYKDSTKLIVLCQEKYKKEIDLFKDNLNSQKYEKNLWKEIDQNIFDKIL